MRSPVIQAGRSRLRIPVWLWVVSWSCPENGDIYASGTQERDLSVYFPTTFTHYLS